ncbi:MAG TPA: ferrous iron transport protein A [Firmicutes bacterium]|jgi:Fe2+ transport system protein FeoA|nr:fe2+ transport system protein A [Clostridium sp. CAG:288]HAR47802.1 ferrous iron transport protein A [Bacillota bacterium]HAX00710.1 ferrous iron transport protein A [Bacillota bacterium]HCY67944.1 ferrous iron transport protein A [Bacillota bacterium]
MEKTLNEVEVGEVGTIVRVAGTGIIRRRLFDMGITPGAQFSFRKKAPLGDPIEITIRGYELTLRKVEAQNVVVEVTGGN